MGCAGYDYGSNLTIIDKVERAVHLRFDLARSPSLDDATKRRLAGLAKQGLTADGVLVLFAQPYCSQERDREDAPERSSPGSPRRHDGPSTGSGPAPA